MTCREKEREKARAHTSERDSLVATPGVYYKGGIKYTGCQKMKCHPTAFLVDPLFVRRVAAEGWGHVELRKREKEEP